MMRTLIVVALMGLAPAAMALTCDELQAQIEAKLRAGGLKQVTVLTVEAASSAPGRVVGSCDRGARKILYRAGEPGATPSPRNAAPILTECKDGSVSMGGTCGRK
jgi:hypothetical protein